ncbi:GrdX family protein [Oceanidesulfovibrio marinus]|uniref:Uncharacterized protein n=1 Tax=Oceanidesulfovibrio marinus TaxID=370038 RepID=A0ABX6NBK8_9BACT|nr:GrdX family protein [Oceanidesulfovibrio marinus]QJT07554.1 hypothetical protein E8L03_00860 [Oceanidesulfovibrio marinus]
MEYVILTNNGSIIGTDLQDFAVIHVPGGIEAIYEAISDHLQNGYALVSSPLPANVPLIRSPIRSVILEKNSRKYDAQGLITLEKAKARTAIVGVHDTGRTRFDLECINKDQLLLAIRQLKEFDLCSRLEYSIEQDGVTPS